jgi:hypothetical protein
MQKHVKICKSIISHVKLNKSTFEKGALSIELFHPIFNETGNVMVVASHPINSMQKSSFLCYKNLAFSSQSVKLYLSTFKEGLLPLKLFYPKTIQLKI